VYAPALALEQLTGINVWIAATRNRVFYGLL